MQTHVNGDALVLRNPDIGLRQLVAGGALLLMFAWGAWQFVFDTAPEDRGRLASTYSSLDPRRYIGDKDVLSRLAVAAFLLVFVWLLLATSDACTADGGHWVPTRDGRECIGAVP